MPRSMPGAADRPRRDLGEFELIARYLAGRDEGKASGLVLGPGDDCALLSPSPGHQLAVSVDTSVVDVHFPAAAPAYAVGHRALAVALSDLAAMGARARWCTMALTIPQVDETWVADFSDGFHALCRESDVCLIGGDVTRGQLSISVTVHGEVPPNQALRRSGGQAGDLLAVTGALGGGLGGLKAWQAGERDLEHELLKTYLLPRPRLAAGLILNDLAHCAIDISDGLLADLGHICQASGVGAELNLSQLPLVAGLETALGQDAARRAALTGGDDYELLFSLPPAVVDVARQRLAVSGDTLTVIGHLTETPGIAGIDAELIGGWQHFGGGAS
ncbi:thiamine-phosphate kinase [Halomonas sp. PR-M31]|uniref:thiamine-phosphate kinase n=1 Tax=Halomonas sp. PR-M31 TaxID=1471202 RepID=UPI0020A20005|nr:thiamine-phosphate kinase [Halomonas sp. PR-M31]